MSLSVIMSSYAKESDGKSEVTEMGPVYDAPRHVMETNQEKALTNNICYITTGNASNKCD